MGDWIGWIFAGAAGMFCLVMILDGIASGGPTGDGTKPPEDWFERRKENPNDQ